MAKHIKERSVHPLRTVLQSVFSFLLGLFLALLSVCTVGYAGSDRAYVIGQVTPAVAEQALGEMREALDALTIPSGLPENFFADKLNVELVESSLTRVVTAAYDGADTVPVDQAQLKQLFYDEFQEYLRANPVVLEATEEALLFLADTCTNAILPYLNPLLMREAATVLGMVHPPLQWGCVALAVLAVLAAALLLGISKTGMQRVAYIEIAVAMAGLLLFPLPAYALRTGLVQRVGLLSPSQHTFVTRYLEALLTRCTAVGLACFAVALLLTLGLLIGLWVRRIRAKKAAVHADERDDG